MAKQTSKSKSAGITPLPAVFKRPSDPEDVQGKPWTFEESEQGTTDLAHRHMTLPMGEDDQSHGVRSHEMLHAALSPMPTSKMDTYFLAAEDGRIESIATAKGIKRTSGIPEDAHLLASLLAGGDVPAAVTTAVAVVGAPNETCERDALVRLGTPEARELLDLMDWSAEQYAADPSVASAHTVAGRLRDILGAPQPQAGDGGGKSESGNSDGESSESNSDGAPSSDALKAAASAAPSDTGKPGKMPGVHGVSIPKPPKPVESDDSAGEVRERKTDTSAQPGRPKEVFPVDMDAIKEWMPVFGGMTGIGAHPTSSKWAQAKLEYPARPQVLVQRENGHKRSRATDYGTVPVRMHRMTIDSKVFASRKHKRQGTVLIDQSGSMSLSSEDIRELIDYAPAAVIAGYWGNRDGTGTIRVLAAGGKMVRDRDLLPAGSANEIDGPAVAWLAAQRAPRVWVCDGVITTTGDRSAGIIPGSKTARDFSEEWIEEHHPLTEAGKQLVRVMTKARITLVGKIGEAKKYLR